MVKDVDKEYRDTMEEVMLGLKLKTDKFLQKLKEESKNDRFKYWEKLWLYISCPKIHLTNLWFLLPFFKIYVLSDDEVPTKLTIREIVLKGSIIAIITTIPSIIAFVLTWIFLDDLIYAVILGAMVYFIAMIVSLKISKKFLVKK